MDLSHKKILVTGGAGFLGRYVVNALIERGVPKRHITVPRLRTVDLRRWNDCQRAVAGHDVVIHLAARVGGVALQQKQPGQFFYDNLIMGAHLLEAARQSGVQQVVAAGSITSYPDASRPPFREKDFWNGDVAGGYGMAKRILWAQARAYERQYRLLSWHLVLPNLYGPPLYTPTPAHQSLLVPTIIIAILQAQARKENDIELQGSGTAQREFLYIADAAEAVVRALETSRQPDILNIGPGAVMSVKNLASAIARIMNFSGTIKWNRKVISDRSKRFLDARRAKAILGFQPRVDLEAGLRNTVAWYLEHQKEYL